MEQYLMDRLDDLVAKGYIFRHTVKHDFPTIILELNGKVIAEISANEIRKTKYKDNGDTYIEISYDFGNNFSSFLDNINVEDF